jgi:hypothetical protein
MTADYSSLLSCLALFPILSNFYSREVESWNINKKFPDFFFFGIQRFSTVFTRAREWSISWAIECSSPTHLIPLPSWLFLSWFPNKILTNIPCVLIVAIGLHFVQVYCHSGQPVSWTTFETVTLRIKVTNFLKRIFTKLMFCIPIENMSFLLAFLQRVLNADCWYILHRVFLLVRMSASPENGSVAYITYTCLTRGSVQYNYTLLNGSLPQGFMEWSVSHCV